jgi:hypothetical protein
MVPPAFERALIRATVSAMSDYDRSTTATTLERLPEPLRAAVLERAEAALLTLPPGSRAFLTHNKRLKGGGFLRRVGDKDAEHFVALVIGPADVLIGIHGEHRGSSVLNARLEDVELSDLAQRLAVANPKLAQAASTVGEGIEVMGFAATVDGQTSHGGSFFFGTGDPDGAAARTALEAAIRVAKAVPGAEA